jgi:hypothetical protein
MAYVVKYRSILHPPKWSVPVYIDILKNGYSGAITTLVMAKGGASLIVEETDYFDPIVSTSVELNYINTLTDFFENLHDWDDLLAIDDFEFMVKVYDPNYIYFEGFLPCDVIEQQFFPKGTVTLNASINLKRLSDFNPTLFTTRSKYTLIDIIKHCLGKTGLTLPIYVNCSLFGYESYLGNIFSNPYTPTYVYSTVTRSIFDWLSVESDLFLKNDLEYESCLTVLTSILTAFNCKIYYWNGKWYIERVKDLGHSTKHFIVYSINGTTTTENETNTSLEIGNVRTKLTHKELSQSVSYVPGVKQIVLNLKEVLRYNLTNYFYTGIVELHSIIIKEETILPPLFVWELIFGTITTLRYNYYNIAYGYVIPGSEYHVLSSTNRLGARYSLQGLFTGLNFALNDSNTSTLTVKLKFRLGDGAITSYGASIKANPTKLFYARMVLKNYAGGTSKFLKYNTSTQIYEFITRGSNDDSNSLITTNGTSVDMAVISQSISYENFTDKKNFETEISINIPLSDATGRVSNDYVLGICRLSYNLIEAGTDPIVLNYTTFGDIVVNLNEDLGDNTITGNVNDHFVSIKQIDVSLYNASYCLFNNKVNVLNELYGIGTGGVLDAFYVPSAFPSGGIPQLTLSTQKKIIEDQYQIYNKVRHSIISDFYYRYFLKPLKQVSSWYYANKFMIYGYRWVIDSNEYNGTVLKEYVDNDSIS